MSGGRKPRSDAKLRNLPPDQRTALVDWLVDEGISYDVALKRIESEFGVKSSKGALTEFWRRECYGLTFRKARRDSDALQEILRERGGESFDEAAIAAIGQRFYEASVAKDGNVKDLQALAGILGDSAKLGLKKQEVALAERRVAAMEKKLATVEETATDDNLTPEERLRKIRVGLKV